MYFESTIRIDPSQVTSIEKVKPTKAFKRMLYHLTKGGISEKEERETFTAISILQQLNKAFIQQGITNVIRLSHDDIDFYLEFYTQTLLVKKMGIEYLVIWAIDMPQHAPFVKVSILF